MQLIYNNHELADMACCILYCQRDINIGGLKTPPPIGGSDLGVSRKLWGYTTPPPYGGTRQIPGSATLALWVKCQAIRTLAV
jgi:hypothetical protein